MLDPGMPMMLFDSQQGTYVLPDSYNYPLNVLSTMLKEQPY